MNPQTREYNGLTVFVYVFDYGAWIKYGLVFPDDVSITTVVEALEGWGVIQNELGWMRRYGVHIRPVYKRPTMKPDWPWGPIDELSYEWKAFVLKNPVELLDGDAIPGGKHLIPVIG